MTLVRAPIVETAAAKINLYLHVTGRRSDGYHLIDSLAVFVDVADAVTARESAAAAPELTLAGPFAQALANEPPQSNLAVRAVWALATRLGRTPQAALALEKNLPVASGVGGGSADAAAALRALARLWDVALDDPRLYMAAEGLGADVPVCLANRPCFMAGVGELLTEAPPLPNAWIVLVNPGVGVATPQVFKARRGHFSPPAPFARAPADLPELTALLAERRNDLTDAAVFLCPVIEDVLAALRTCRGSRFARMSGSGATCFALFDTEAAAKAAATALTVEHPEWWTKAGRMLSRPAHAPPLPDPDFFRALTDAARKIDMTSARTT